ncbi:MAG: hypothetical protein ACK51E_11060 [Gemmatimonadota bacterium]
MRMPQAVLGVAVALLALTAPVRPQDAGPDAGRAVRLTLRTGGKVPGRFDRWSRGTVWVDRGDGPIALPRPDVVRWEEPVPGTRRSRWRAVLGWGALLGTTGGAVVGATMHAEDWYDRPEYVRR